MRRLVRPVALLGAIGLLAAGCAGEASPERARTSSVAEPESDIPCDPPATRIQLVAFLSEAGKPPSFDRSCISVPAGEPFTVRLLNQDFLEHNFAVFADEDATELLYRGDRFRGPKERLTYQVPAIEETGQYVFLCDVHRTLMKGALLVQ